MCIPGLLDGLHPFIALTLLLCPQFQRFLSIVTKDDEEVVLKREKIKREKAVSIRDCETQQIASTTSQHHLFLTLQHEMF